MDLCVVRSTLLHVNASYFGIHSKSVTQFILLLEEQSDLGPHCLPQIRFKRPSRHIPPDEIWSGLGSAVAQCLIPESRPRGCGFESHRRHCDVVFEQDTFILALIVLVQPRKTHSCLTERLLMKRKESNQTSKIWSGLIRSTVALLIEP